MMQCGVEERMIRNIRIVAVECFKYRKKELKCRWCPLWKRKVKRVAYLKEGKAHQEERRLAHPIREKVQEGEKRLRRVEEGEAACSV